jgi:hypothetical protein
VEAFYQALMVGLQGGTLGDGELLLSTGDITAEAIVTQLQTALETFAPAKAAYATWRAAVAKQDQAKANVAPLVTALRQYIRARYGTGSLTLAQFGLSARARKVPTVAAKAVSVANAKATRQANKSLLAGAKSSTASSAASASGNIARSVGTGTA